MESEPPADNLQRGHYDIFRAAVKAADDPVTLRALGRILQRSEAAPTSEFHL